MWKLALRQLRCPDEAGRTQGEKLNAFGLEIHTEAPE
jgi:hypothetical protein